MDLEIVGRHALLFDDDATAEVVNSGGSLVPWAAVGAKDLLLDRHDVRHLLDRVPPRPRRSYSAALLSAPTRDGVSEAELDRERFLDLPADDGGDGDDGTRDAHPSGDEGTGQSGYKAVPFSYGSTADSDDPNSSNSYYRPPFSVPENLLNKLPPSEKVHQIIARTALFVNQHGGQSEIVLRVKQGSNPTFGFLMPDHHLHSYFRYLVDHPQLLKDGADAEDTDKDYKRLNTEAEPAPAGGALSLLGTAYDSGDEEEGAIPANTKNGTGTLVQDHGNPASILPDNEELRKDQTVAAESVGKTILMKKNPVLTGNSFVAAQREKAKDAAVKSQDTISGLAETKEMILEPPSFLKRTMEKIVEFILRNGKEFEEKLIDQDRTTGRFPFLLSSNPYHSYYLKMLQETQESKSRCRSPENKDRRNSDQRKGRSPSDRMDRRSSSHRKDISHIKERSRSMERPTTFIDARAPDRSSAEPSEKQQREHQGKGKFHVVVGVKKEPPRKVTADEAAAIVMAATRGLSGADDSRNTVKEMRDSVPTLVSNDRSSSFGSLSSLQVRDAPSKHTSNSEADTSLTSSGQLKKESTGIIDDDWIANTIAKAAAVAASKEADSSEAAMTKEEKLKAERLRRAKMFAAIIKSGGSKMNDLVTVAGPSNEPVEAPHPDDMNALPPAAKEREGSSVPFEREGSVVAKDEKDSDDERNRVRKYRKKHYPESDEDKNDSEESYKPSRKRHRSEHSRGHGKDVDKHKSHSKDGESRHRRRQHSSSEDEHEHRSSKSRHRHRDRDHYDDDYRRSRRHRRHHRSSSRRDYEDERDQIEQTVGRSEASPRTSGPKIEQGKPPIDTAESSGATEVSNELRAKIRAMLLETL